MAQPLQGKPWLSGNGEVGGNNWLPTKKPDNGLPSFVFNLRFVWVRNEAHPPVWQGRNFKQLLAASASTPTGLNTATPAPRPVYQYRVRRVQQAAKYKSAGTLKTTPNLPQDSRIVKTIEWSAGLHRPCRKVGRGSLCREPNVAVLPRRIAARQRDVLEAVVPRFAPSLATSFCLWFWLHSVKWTTAKRESVQPPQRGKDTLRSVGLCAGSTQGKMGKAEWGSACKFTSQLCVPDSMGNSCKRRKMGLSLCIGGTRQQEEHHSLSISLHAAFSRRDFSLFQHLRGTQARSKFESKVRLDLLISKTHDFSMLKAFVSGFFLWSLLEAFPDIAVSSTWRICKNYLQAHHQLLLHCHK